MVIAKTVAIPDVRVGRVPLFLGDASYSLYLVHLPAMGILWRLGADFPVLVAGSVAMALAYHVAVEKPLLSLTRSALKRPLRRHALDDVEVEHDRLAKRPT
jgi:peptidoglycan/LPS O-acetylase OafA/YrhL